MSIQPDDIPILQRLLAIDGYLEINATINGMAVGIEWEAPVSNRPGPIAEAGRPDTATADTGATRPVAHYVRAPAIGRPHPDMFQVAVGDAVTAGQTLVLLAQGDTTVAVQADVAGTVTAVRDYGTTGLVHHGHWLLVIEPDGGHRA